MVTADRRATVAELRQRLANEQVPSREKYLPVIPALADVLPGGGLPLGGLVSLDGAGATSVLFALLAGPSVPWAAMIGLPHLGWLAAAELGVNLDRIVLVPDPGPDVLQIVSILADGFDVIVLRVNGPLPSPARLRVLRGRLRQQGTVLVSMGRWMGADLSLSVGMGGWQGIGEGHGRLVTRELMVQVSGRGMGRPQRTRLMLNATDPTVRDRVSVSKVMSSLQEERENAPVAMAR